MYVGSRASSSSVHLPRLVRLTLAISGNLVIERKSSVRAEEYVAIGIRPIVFALDFVFYDTSALRLPQRPHEPAYTSISTIALATIQHFARN